MSTVYLLSFTMEINRMQVNLPYMDPMGCEHGAIAEKCVIQIPEGFLQERLNHIYSTSLNVIRVVSLLLIQRNVLTCSIDSQQYKLPPSSAEVHQFLEVSSTFGILKPPSSRLMICDICVSPPKKENPPKTLIPNGFLLRIWVFPKIGVPLNHEF